MDADILVVGAGIQGAAVAQAGAAAGYRVLLLEQALQAATGASSKSSKLIHGGLRYLESGELRLVRECLVERRLLLRNAPHLVRLQPFHIPVYRDTVRRPWKIGVGLGLYALLGGKGFARLPRAQWAALDGLRTEGLQSLYRYYDAQTDDAALTRAVLESARALGAELHFGARFERADCEGAGCRVYWQERGREHSVEASVLVNAAGAWANRVLGAVHPEPAAVPVELVQGAHLVLRGRLQRGMYYLEAPQDRRAVFVMPWKQQVLLGTTETAFNGDPASVEPQDAEIDYLLEVYNHYFTPNVRHADIAEAFAGLRVLPRTGGSLFHRSRDALLHRDAQRCPRVLTLYGGKLTAYRAVAERVVARLRPLLPRRTAQADTRTLRLPEVD